MIAVLGAGSWGTALALQLARNGLCVKLWCHRSAHANALSQARENRRYLPGIPLPDAIDVVGDLDAIVRAGVSDYVVVVPSAAYRQTLSALKDSLAANGVDAVTITCATKGFDPETQQLLGDIGQSVLPHADALVLSGPGFALDLAQGLPVAVALAGTDADTVTRVQALFHGNNLRVYRNRDFRGVQIAGAVKNVIAIATGIADGLALGASARAALITRGLAETVRLGTTLGGAGETFYGLAGAGDLILSCTDDKSRNRRAGLGIGRGQSLQQVLADIGQKVEGAETVKSTYALSLHHRVSMPINTQVYRVLYEALAPQQALTALLERQPGVES